MSRLMMKKKHFENIVGNKKTLETALQTMCEGQNNFIISVLFDLSSAYTVRVDKCKIWSIRKELRTK